MAIPCDPMVCWRDTIRAIGEAQRCISRALGSLADIPSIAGQLYQQFCGDNINALDNNDVLVNQIANDIGREIQSRIQGAMRDTKLGTRAPCAGAGENKYWCACFGGSRPNWKVGGTNANSGFAALVADVVRGILGDKSAARTDFCTAFLNNAGCANDELEGLCIPSLAQWVHPITCMQNTEYQKSKFRNERGELTEDGIKRYTIICGGGLSISGIWVIGDDGKEFDGVDAPCYGTAYASIGTLEAGIGEDELFSEQFTDPATKAAAFKALSGKILEKWKEEMQKGLEFLQEDVSIAEQNITTFIAKLSSALNLAPMKDSGILQYFMAQIMEKLRSYQPSNLPPHLHQICQCLSERIWGAPNSNLSDTCKEKTGITIPPEGGVFRKDWDAQWECWEKLKRESSGDRVTAEASFPWPGPGLPTEEWAREQLSGWDLDGSIQCASAENIEIFPEPGRPGMVVVRYVFHPSKLWNPQATEDACSSAPQHAHMDKIVKLLNDTRTPGCGKSVMHSWVMNLFSCDGNYRCRPVGWGEATINGKDQSCIYTWPNMTDNPDRGGQEGARYVLPEDCQTVPITLNTENTLKFNLNLFLFPYMLKMLPRPKGTGLLNGYTEVVNKIRELMNKPELCTPPPGPPLLNVGFCQD